MHLLFISQYYTPETGAGSARVAGLAENLVRLGHSVTVLTGFPNYPGGIVPREYRGRLSMTETINGVEVIRMWSFTSPEKTAFRRLLTYGTFALSTTIRGLATDGRFDGIFASSPPLFVGIPALVVSMKKRIPYIFDVRDIWPEIAVLLDVIKSESIVTKAAGWLEAKLYTHASRVSVVTQGKLDKLVGKGIPAEKIFVLSNGVDDEFLMLPDDLVVRSDLGFMEDDFIVTYIGTIGLAQGVGILLDAADRLRDKPNIKFLIVGEGVEKLDLIARANAIGLKSIKFLPLQPKHKLPSLLSISDVAFASLKSDVLTDSVPSKLYEYLGIGCPIILAATGDSCDLVRKAGAGVVTEPGNVDQVVRAITDLSMNRAQRRRYAENGRTYIRQHFLRSDLAKRLEGVFMSVCMNEY